MALHGCMPELLTRLINIRVEAVRRYPRNFVVEVVSLSVVSWRKPITTGGNKTKSVARFHAKYAFRIAKNLVDVVEACDGISVFANGPPRSCRIANSGNTIVERQSPFDRNWPIQTLAMDIDIVTIKNTGSYECFSFAKPFERLKFCWSDNKSPLMVDKTTFETVQQ